MAVLGLAIGGTFVRASNQDIVDTAVGAGQFKTLAAALDAADLVETLKGPGPFTVFAPTDEAFAKLPAGTVEELLKPENKAKLTAILTYHVVPGAVKAEKVTQLSEAKTINGAMVKISRRRQSDDQRRQRREGQHPGVERRHPRHRQGHPAALDLIGPRPIKAGPLHLPGSGPATFPSPKNADQRAEE